MVMSYASSQNLVIVVVEGIKPFVCDREMVAECLEVIKTSKEAKRG